MSVLLILLVIAVIVIGYGIAVYNRLVDLKNRINNSFSQIDVQLQRRYDLIPNLVETAKSYMKYEQETLTAIIDARNTAKQAASQAATNPSDPSTMKSLNTAESGLTNTLGKLFALVENYPDLKANQNMQQLMEELTSTENKISFARQAFNDSVMTFNTYRTQFPPVIVANQCGFQNAQFFEITNKDAKEPVKVSL
jgi:LemA protein